MQKIADKNIKNLLTSQKTSYFLRKRVVLLSVLKEIAFGLYLMYLFLKKSQIKCKM